MTGVYFFFRVLMSVVFFTGGAFAAHTGSIPITFVCMLAAVFQVLYLVLDLVER